MEQSQMLTKAREHVNAMGYAQRDAWGLDYIDLYLIHFPVALKYIEPEKLPYPVRAAFYFSRMAANIA